jgi:type IV secretion system protein VirB9
MVITTTQRTYHLQLHSTNKTAMMVVKWHYPAIKPSPQMAAVKSRQQMLDDLSLKSLDFHYQISLKEGPKPAWMPLTVFSDAGKTYIQFPAQMQQAPLLFIGHSPGSDEIVNYRVAGNYYVIDSVVNNAQLRLGRSAGLLSVVQITKEGS